jgi:uncharacterized integral membrane protein
MKTKQIRLKYILLIILLVLFIIFIFQNTASVTVRFLTFEAMMPRALLLTVTLALGVLIGIFVPYRLKKEGKET